MDNKARILVTNTPSILLEKGAEIFSRASKEGVARKGLFSVALSGGSTPRGMHRLLSREPYHSVVPWKGTHIFWVDERCVPRDHHDSNYGSARKDLLDSVPIPSEQVHPIPTGVSPEEGARQYQKEITDFFDTSEVSPPAFDLIFLGIGMDGHTASLFPGQTPLTGSKKWVISVKGGTPFVNRITMTYPLLNLARQVVFTVSGRGKAGILKTIFEEKNARLPAQAIRPSGGGLLWLLDRDAASLLPERLIQEDTVISPIETNFRNNAQG